MWRSVIAFGGKGKKDKELSQSISRLIISQKHVEAVCLQDKGEAVQGFSDLSLKCVPNSNEQMTSFDIPRFDQPGKRAPKAIPQAETYSFYHSARAREFSFCKELAEKNNLIFIAFDFLDASEEPSQMAYCSNLTYAAQEKRIALSEAQRRFGCFQLHAAFYDREGRLKHVVNWARKKNDEEMTNPINAQKYLRIRVSFWDMYIDRIQAPHIAEVRVEGSKARYYVADELQRLQLFFEEELPAITVNVPEASSN